MKRVLASFVFVAFLAGGVLYPPTGPGALYAQKKAAKQKPVDRKKTEEKADPSTEKTKAREKLGPMAVFSDIESGWRTEKLDKILRHFGKGKVAISIHGTGPAGGAFSRNQSHYLFKDLFDYTITQKFEFVQYRNVSNGKLRVYAVAEREYKRNDDGRTFKDKIYVALQPEGERWVIGEIKSVR